MLTSSSLEETRVATRRKRPQRTNEFGRFAPLDSHSGCYSGRLYHCRNLARKRPLDSSPSGRLFPQWALCLRCLIHVPKTSEAPSVARPASPQVALPDGRHTRQADAAIPANRRHSSGNRCRRNDTVGISGTWARSTSWSANAIPRSNGTSISTAPARSSSNRRRASVDGSTRRRS
jgi:hypothetical protein